MPVPFVPIALGLSGVLGGMLSKQGYSPKIDPATLERLFGATASYDETNKLFEFLSNSPAFQSILQGYDVQGQSIGQDLNARFGGAGVNPNQGGVAAVLASSAGQASNYMRTGAKASLYQTASDQARQSIRDRMQAYITNEMNRGNTPTWQQNIGSALMGAAGSGLGSYVTGAANKTRTIGGGTGVFDDATGGDMSPVK